jgi:hypothetical protein
MSFKELALKMVREDTNHGLENSGTALLGSCRHNPWIWLPKQPFFSLVRVLTNLN